MGPKAGGRGGDTTHISFPGCHPTPSIRPLLPTFSVKGHVHTHLLDRCPLSSALPASRHGSVQPRATQKPHLSEHEPFNETRFQPNVEASPAFCPGLSAPSQPSKAKMPGASSLSTLLLPQPHYPIHSQAATAFSLLCVATSTRMAPYLGRRGLFLPGET